MGRSEPLDLDRAAQVKRYAASNPGRRSLIERLRASGRACGGVTRRRLCSTAARAEARRRWAKLALRGSIQAEVWPRSMSTAWMIHLWHRRDSGRLRGADVAAVAALGVGARRRAAFRGFQGLRPIQTSAKTTEEGLGKGKKWARRKGGLDWVWVLLWAGF